MPRAHIPIRLCRMVQPRNFAVGQPITLLESQEFRQYVRNTRRSPFRAAQGTLLTHHVWPQLTVQVKPSHVGPNFPASRATQQSIREFERVITKTSHNSMSPLREPEASSTAFTLCHHKVPTQVTRLRISLIEMEPLSARERRSRPTTLEASRGTREHLRCTPPLYAKH